jgi:putative flippase GtrA
VLALLDRLLARLRAGMHVIARELVKFGVVGAVAYVVDVSLFNLLRFGGPALLEDRPLTAKAISVAVATVVAWLGNRYCTFRRRRRVAVRRELVLFVLMNGAGMGIALACLAVSHYLLGFTSPVADNISANVVGLALGTAFRFYAYRTWVFTEIVDDGPVDVASAMAAAASADTRSDGGPPPV